MELVILGAAIVISLSIYFHSLSIDEINDTLKNLKDKK